MLQQIIGSRGRTEVLRLLFTPEHLSLYLRELARRAGLSAPVLLRELRQLCLLGLVLEVKDGNRVNFSANASHPLYQTLCELVHKTEGEDVILRDAFADIEADFIFIYGSCATGNATAQSDIDLFVIGDVGLREVTRRIHSVSDRISREINPYVISKAEFLQRQAGQDHFITGICSAQKIFLKGTCDEFTAMESEWLAAGSPNQSAGNRQFTGDC